MIKILVVEDDKNTLSGLIEILSDEGYDVFGKSNSRDALNLLQKEQFDVMLCDLRLPEINGMELFDLSREFAPQMKTILMTAYSSVKDAVESMKKGVYEYLTKPLNLEELFIIISKAVEEKEIRRENIELKDQLRTSYHFANIIGNSDAMRNVFKIIEKVSKSHATVLLRGESGVGKELVARAIHYNSPRADRPLLEVSCASLPETLLESELFGYEKGAFTGATSTKKGRFELAQGGTIFLDEIGDIPESVQTKLLRVLQEKEISRLGSTTSMKIDVRVITATNRNLEEALKSGRFREDLYYRLNVIPIIVPPLRERREDIPLLIEFFTRKYGEENNKPQLKVSEEALNLCMDYHWPGNVRELENAIENAVVLGEGDVILPEHLPFHIYTKGYTDLRRDIQSRGGKTYREKMDFAERVILKEAIEQSEGNKSKAAKKLKISLRTMRYKIKRHKL
ncbi:sigma-54-dependent Fis family transcriptional regulator [candidate division KSB1 bacterium]|nr:sigma-54-dependent Fis family transcriptional regulator [candidate division KSB1 bacterium]